MSEEKKPTFVEKFNSPVSVLWEKHKIFLIGFGLLILIWKFREVIIDVLVSSSRKTVQDAVKQDASLKKEQDLANDQADQLRKEAEDLSKNKPSVDEDWHKK